MKGNQRTLYRQIASQFQGKRTIPFVARDQEISHGRDITWTLRALAEGFREAVGGTAAHSRELGWHQLDRGDDRYRHQRRQTV